MEGRRVGLLNWPELMGGSGEGRGAGPVREPGARGQQTASFPRKWGTGASLKSGSQGVWTPASRTVTSGHSFLMLSGLRLDCLGVGPAE